MLVSLLGCLRFSKLMKLYHRERRISIYQNASNLAGKQASYAAGFTLRLVPILRVEFGISVWHRSP